MKFISLPSDGSQDDEKLCVSAIEFHEGGMIIRWGHQTGKPW